MARELITKLVDDVNGEDVEVTEHRFYDLEGKAWEIDLGPTTRARLDRAQQAYLRAMAPFLEKGRRVVEPARRQPTTPRRRPARINNTAIRQWAAARGIIIGDRGRIKTEVIERYLAEV